MPSKSTREKIIKSTIKKFDGKNFFLRQGANSKPLAQKRAKTWRNKGFKARVHKFAPGVYGIYTRKK